MNPRALPPLVRRSVGKRGAEPPRPKTAREPVRRRIAAAWARLPRRWRGLAASAAVLPALLMLYTAVRAVMYAASGAAAVDRLPADPDLVIHLPDLAGSFERWQSTGAWESITQRILRDPAARGRINEALEEGGLPTLDRLEDQRFLNSPQGRLYRPDTLLDVLGRDAAVALRVNPEGRWNFLTCQKLGFLHYWALPVVRLWPALAGAERDAAGMKFAGVHVAFDGPLALISDEPRMIAEAFDDTRRHRMARRHADAPIVVETSLRTEEIVEACEVITGTFPLGALLHFADVRSMTGARLTLDLQGTALVGEAELAGATAAVAEPAALEALLDRVPERTFYVQPTAARGRDLWGWLSRAVTGPPGAAATIQWANTDLAFTIKLATQHGFERDVLPMLDGPSLLAFGWEATEYPDAFGAEMLVGAVLFHCSDARAAERGVRRVLESILLKEFKDKAHLNSFERDGASVHLIETGSGGRQTYEPLYFVQPCAARIGDILAIATHPSYLANVIDAGQGGRRFREGEHWRQYQKDLAPFGLGDPVSGAVTTAFLNLDSFRKVSLVFIGPMAEFQEMGPQTLTRIRQQIERDTRLNGLQRTPDEISREVMDEAQRRINLTSEQLRAQVDVLQWFGTLGLRAEPMEGGLRVKGAMNLYRTGGSK